MKPDIKELIKYREYNIVPVYEEIFSDFTTPMNVLRKIKEVSKQFYLLESVEASQFGRYSYLGFNPVMEISCKDNRMRVKDKEYYSPNPFAELKGILADYRAPRFANLPPFSGGLVGYASYDSYKYFEPKLKINSLDVGFKDFEFLLFDKVICFDHFLQKIFLIVNIRTEHLEEGYANAEFEIRRLKEFICQYRPFQEEKPILKEIPQPIDTKDKYIEKVNQIKKHIYRGDIFQCVLSRRFKGRMKGSLLEVYRHLRTINPSPYMYYYKNKELEIVGASPETLVSKDKEIITTFPIAGTRPRGKDLADDLQLERELLADEKECAEHNMLVDLGRNDIGRVSKFSSVRVAEYKKILRFSHVMHIASTVCGEIQEGKTSVDVLQSVLPAGTLSGAPKLRACGIIDSLEQERRGIYGGGIGYIDFADNMNICIVIRTIIKRNDEVFIQAGGGIVMDSDPEAEYQEIENKARAVFKAVDECREDTV